MKTRYWIGVVSLSHVQRGVAGGFAQLCHGKSGPLKRMNIGDWLLYYSPKTDMHEGKPLQQFTAIGKVTGGSVYEFPMAPDFVPYRRDIDYATCKPVSIQPLISHLAFIKDPKHWGYIFRTGHFEIPEKDFLLIKNAMEISIHE